MASVRTEPYNGPWFTYPTPNEIIAAGTVLPTLGVIIVALRFYNRRRSSAGIGLDDWLVLPALAFVIGMGICIVYGVAKKSMGFPSPQIDPRNPTAVARQTVLLQKLEWGLLQLMIAAYGVLKISILCFYRRIFIVDRGGLFNRVTLIFIAIIVVWTVAFYFAYAFVCGTHFWAYWGNILVSSKYCSHVLQISEGLLISDLVTDVIVLCAPLPIVWTLHMPTNRKLAVTGIFLLGGMALAASATRLALFTFQVRRGYDPTEDIGLAISTQLYWSMIEAGLALIAACLPTLRNLFDRPPLKNLLRSVRRVTSLCFRWPMASRDGSHYSKPYSRSKKNLSNISQAHLSERLPSEDPTIGINTEIVGDSRDSTNILHMDKIHVQKSIQQGHDPV